MVWMIQLIKNDGFIDKLNNFSNNINFTSFINNFNINHDVSSQTWMDDFTIQSRCIIKIPKQNRNPSTKTRSTPCFRADNSNKCMIHALITNPRSNITSNRINITSTKHKIISKQSKNKLTNTNNADGSNPSVQQVVVISTQIII